MGLLALRLLAFAACASFAVATTNVTYAPGSACVGYAYSPAMAPTATPLLNLLTYNLSNPGAYPDCYNNPLADSGILVSTTGVVIATANGKGLGYTTTAQRAWLTTVLASGASPATDTSLQLYFTSGVSNTVNRGDQITVYGYLLDKSYQGDEIFEVCAFAPTPGTANLGSLSTSAYGLPVTTAQFTAPADLAVQNYGANSSLIAATNERVGGWCAASTKPYGGQLVTFFNVTVLPCNNTVTIAPSSGKLSYYSICQPTLSPLADTYTTVSPGRTLCTSCVWDKYSTFWITTDAYLGYGGKQTGVAVSAQLFRVFNSYTVTAGTRFASLSGMLDWQQNSVTGWPAGIWTLIPRDANDVVGGTALSPASVPTIAASDVDQVSLAWAAPASGTVGGPYYVPQSLVGTSQLIGGVGSTAQAGVYGTGDYFNEGYTGFASGCPNTSAFQWIYDHGQTTQNLCDCYPPSYYSPLLGSSGAGTSYLYITGIVSNIEGVTSGSGTGSFYLQSGCGINQALFVYQNGAAGKLVTLGDSVTIFTTPYSYYGLLEMQNTLSVVVNSHSNPVCPPLELPTLAPLDVNTAGHCSPSIPQYRANRVVVRYVTVTKVFFREPFPLNLNYWYNGTNLGSAYSAAFNASKLYTGNSNWYNSGSCKDAFGNTLKNPETGKSYICSFEVVDRYGNKAVVDECPYSSTGGTVNVFQGTGSVTNNTFVAGDGIGHVLRVGDTFTSITGVLKYAHGSWGNDGEGGYLPICMLMDPTLLAGRNQAFPSNATGSVVAAAAVVGAQVTVPNINFATWSDATLATVVPPSLAASFKGSVSVAAVDYPMNATVTVAGSVAAAALANASATQLTAIGNALEVAAASVLSINFDYVTVTLGSGDHMMGGRRSLLQSSTTFLISVAGATSSAAEASSLVARFASASMTQLLTIALGPQGTGGITPAPATTVAAASVSAVVNYTLALTDATQASAAKSALATAVAPLGSIPAALAASLGVTASSVAVTSPAAVTSGAPPSSSSSSNDNKDLAIGLGVGLGGGLFLLLCASCAAYFCCLKKRNVETGHKEAVVMTAEKPVHAI